VKDEQKIRFKSRRCLSQPAGVVVTSAPDVLVISDLSRARSDVKLLYIIMVVAY
jgi:hypothetical protein